MTPYGGCTVAPDFEEKHWWHFFHHLYKVLAYEESTLPKGRTSAYPSMDIWLVFRVQWVCNFRHDTLFPLPFELLSPGTTVTIHTSDRPQDEVQFSVVCWCQLSCDNPYQEVNAWFVEVMEEIFLEATPAGLRVSKIFSVFCKS
jgi:hypothetical protein